MIETLLSLLCLESTLLSQRIIKACRVWTTSRYRSLAGTSEHTLGEQFQFSSPSEKVYWTHVVSQKYPWFWMGNGIHDFRLSHSPKKSPISHPTRGFLGNSNLKYGILICEGQGPILPMDLCNKAEMHFLIELQTHSTSPWDFNSSRHAKT